MDSSPIEKAKYVHQQQGNFLEAFDHAMVNGASREDLEKFYDTWATTYDKDQDDYVGGCKHPQHLADNVEKFVKNKGAKILDVACGTGRSGRILKEKGFTNVDGLDGSSGMLEVARGNNLYQNYFQEFVTDAPLMSIPLAAYDAVITTGSFSPGHMTAKNLRPLGLCAKQGGLLIIGVRAMHLELEELKDLEPTMTAMENEGFWKLKEKITVTYHIANFPGMIFVFEKL